MARRTYCHIDYSPAAITLVAEVNWPTLSTTAMAPCPSRRAVSAILATSPAPRRCHKNTSTPAATTMAPRPSRKVTPTTVVFTLTSSIWPPCKAAISVVPASSPAPRHRRKSASAPIAASPAPWPSRKASFAAAINTLTLAS
ncbi:hypothetical protein ACLOJK_034292 [Asimina triloba]